MMTKGFSKKDTWEHLAAMMGLIFPNSSKPFSSAAAVCRPAFLALPLPVSAPTSTMALAGTKTNNGDKQKAKGSGETPTEAVRSGVTPAVAQGSDQQKRAMGRGSLSSSSQEEGPSNPHARGLSKDPEKPQNQPFTPASSPAPSPAPTGTEKVTLEVMACGTVEMLNRPCVDCGRVTGNYCDYCLAVSREPDEEWANGQHTPLCTYCDKDFDQCHFCRNNSGYDGQHGMYCREIASMRRL